MEGKAAVLGSPDFVMPFSALGLDTFPTEADPAAVEENAASILKQKYALVVPFTTEPSGVATEALGRMLVMATGINILKN
jgi:hypothetical protein